MKTFISSDGTWEVKYHSDWVVEEGNDEHYDWAFLNPEAAAPDEAGLTDGEAKIEFLVDANTNNDSIDDLLKRYCQMSPAIDGTVEECRKSTINGRVWAWALRYEDISGGIWVFNVGTVADGKVHQSFAFVPDGAHSNASLAQVREILATFKIEG